MWLLTVALAALVPLVASSGASAAPAAAAGPAARGVAPAHGGSSTAVTSDYRVTVSGVDPPVPGLSARIVDVGGRLEVSWTGAGTLIVEGYDHEPYLRFDTSGVARNVRSPATYLNQDRYARTAVPATADSAATPEWQQISTGHTASWHDHRTHWMDTIPPAVVQADESVAHVIFDRWQVPLTVDGRAATIDGRLAWIPPPATTPWLVAGLAATALLAAALWSRWWRPAAVAMAALGTVVLAVDGFGYLARNHRGAVPWVWAVTWPVVALAATVALAVVLRRRPDRLPIAMPVVGLVLAVVGGLDRIDAVTNSQVFSALPDWSAAGRRRGQRGHRGRARRPLRRRPRGDAGQRPPPAGAGRCRPGDGCVSGRPRRVKPARNPPLPLAPV